MRDPHPHAVLHARLATLEGEPAQARATEPGRQGRRFSPCPPVDAAGYRRGRRRPQDGQRDPDRDRGQPTYRRGSFVAHVRGGTGLTTAPPMPAT